ncbi:MAG: NADH-ubiquinone oxidoreductase-F iron-sulfur binding region domain-containing protein [Clostridium sp.]
MNPAENVRPAERAEPVCTSSSAKLRRDRAVSGIWSTIQDLAETMRLTALCGLGHSTAVPVTSSIQNFYSQYLSHIDRDHCPVCSQTGGEYYDSFED